jgi:hypothetical protein
MTLSDLQRVRLGGLEGGGSHGASVGCPFVAVGQHRAQTVSCWCPRQAIGRSSRPASLRPLPSPKSGPGCTWPSSRGQCCFFAGLGPAPGHYYSERPFCMQDAFEPDFCMPMMTASRNKGAIIENRLFRPEMPVCVCVSVCVFLCLCLCSRKPCRMPQLGCCCPATPPFWSGGSRHRCIDWGFSWGMRRYFAHTGDTAGEHVHYLRACDTK